MPHYIQDENRCQIAENEHFGQLLYCNVCHKRCFNSYSKAMNEIRRQHHSKKKHHDICSRAYQCDKCGFWHLTSQILAKELSGFASRRKRAAYPRPTDRLKQLSELKTVVINPTTSEDIRRFAGAVFLLSHDVGSYDQHLYLHNGFALVHTYSLLDKLPPA